MRILTMNSSPADERSGITSQLEVYFSLCNTVESDAVTPQRPHEGLAENDMPSAGSGIKVSSFSLLTLKS